MAGLGIKKIVLKRISDTKGFTLVELIMVSMILSLLVGGVWGVYWTVVNTYSEEQRGALLQAEGERILDLIATGGYFKGKRIYGVNACYPGHLEVGKRTSASSIFDNDSDDYRIEFALEDSGGSPRYAEFSIEFNGTDNPTSKFWFRLRTPDISGEDHNYDVLITENLLQRKSGTDPTIYGNYDKTWFKTQKLPDPGSGTYCSGIKVSFYLFYNPFNDPGNIYSIRYNFRLDRKIDPPINDSSQRSKFLGAIPYPQYFLTAVYFSNRVD